VSDTDVAARLAEVRGRLADAARRAGRDPAAVRLVGVAKRQPAARVAAAVAAGLEDVGENFAQELRDKAPDVEARLEAEGLAPPRWHFVGRLQRNKVRLVIPFVSWVQSVDRASLAQELDRRAGAAGRRLDLLLQVDVSDEAQKGGVAPAEAESLLAAAAGLAHVSVVGLMAIPAPAPEAEAMRPAFARLRELRDTLGRAPGGGGLRELSMGMSADFEVAVAEGATMVRVGTAIFGPRDDA
jgi:pyridoxal phosphate enzyme (YggS family)